MRKSQGRNYSNLLFFRWFVTLDPLHHLIHHLGLLMLVGLSHKLGNAFCMLKRTVRREKRIVTEPVPQFVVARLGQPPSVSM